MSLLFPPSPRGDLETTIQRLRRERDAARAELADLRKALYADVVPPEAWGLSRSETIIFQVLVARDLARVETLIAALWPAHPPEDPVACVHSQICKLRGKTKAFGVEITVSRGLGYRLTNRDAYRGMA